MSSSCNSKLVEKPNVLGGCQHFFCKKCVDDYLIGEACPQCGMPSHAKDLMLNRQLSTAVLLLKRLDKLVIDKGHPSRKITMKTSVKTPDRQTNLQSKETAGDANLTEYKGAPIEENKNVDDPELIDQKQTRTKRKSEESKDLSGRGKARKTTRKSKENEEVQNTGDKIGSIFRSSRRKSAQNEQDLADTPYGRRKGIHALTSSDDHLIQPGTSGVTSKKFKSGTGKRTTETTNGTTGKSPKIEKGSTKNLTNSGSSGPRTPVGSRRNAHSRTTTPTSGRVSRQPWFSPSTSTSSYIASPGSTTVSSSPRLLKKNARGETPLHTACIKGDAEGVRQLLDTDSAINVKDHAGWTPLHEAVNHGHVAIAELLLDNGAFINVPGLDNDTPLHDAVENGRVACVKLLVSRGANKSARNSNGKTPVELAKTKAMRDALKVPVIHDDSITTLSQGSYPAYNQAVILTTGLSREQKTRVTKCAAMLHGKQVQQFSSRVTHVVTGVNTDGQCPRTIKYLQALLTGKWILTLAWVDTCLEYGEKVSEEAFEVPGASSSPNSMAPWRARLNMQQQLPGLFDGCQFYFHGEISYPLPEKEDLIELVKLGGGVVLNREPKVDSIDQSELSIPYHVAKGCELENCGYFVVNDGKGVRSELLGQYLCWTKASWVLNCIANFKLLPLE